MIRFRSLVVVLAAVALALSIGTGAFSATTAERGAKISVVPDESAYVGYDTTNRNVKDGDTETILTVTNRLNSQLTIDDVSVSETGSLSVDAETMYSPIDPGDSYDIDATFDCSNSNITETIVVSVTVSSDSTSVDIDGDTTERQFTVSCMPAQ